jgi:hypothetical protein
MLTDSPADPRPPARPRSRRAALLALAREELSVLLALWLIFAVPVACPDGPMGLLLPADHAMAAANHAGGAPAGHGGHAVPGDSTSGPATGMRVLDVGTSAVSMLAFAFSALALPTLFRLLLVGAIGVLLLQAARWRARPASAPPAPPPRTPLSGLVCC